MWLLKPSHKSSSHTSQLSNVPKQKTELSTGPVYVCSIWWWVEQDMSHMFGISPGYSLTLVLAAATGDGICCTHISTKPGEMNHFNIRYLRGRNIKLCNETIHNRNVDLHYEQSCTTKCCLDNKKTPQPRSNHR